MDKFQAMSLFVRVVEVGGIARAAESLQIPNATATTLIQRLEASLGVKLLNRTTRRVSVTPDGAAFYSRAATILAELREAEESPVAGGHPPAGTVRVDVPTLIARAVIVPALPGFFRTVPRHRTRARLQRAALRPGRRGHRLRVMERRGRR